MRRAAESSGGVLTLNIGNTTISATRILRGRIANRWSAASNAQSLPLFRAWVAGLSPRPGRGAMACVVPRFRSKFARACRDVLSTVPLELSPAHPLGVTLAYPHPETLGSDRLAILAGASSRIAPPFILMDAGTALTFNVVTSRGFIGGVIAPGPAFFLNYLADRTAQLPSLSPAKHRLPAVGRGTEESMRIGARAGFEGMMRGILEHLRRDPELAGAQIAVTGGGADRVRRALAHERVVLFRDLVHWGLADALRRLPPNTPG
ncbi:MAG: type III pantothenate kinase [Kiritimatiellae bacterium]|nr:type III pantothenate kinase [Kiritimatiellia bacterium]